MKKLLIGLFLFSVLMVSGCTSPMQDTTSDAALTGDATTGQIDTPTLAWHFIDRLDETVQSGDVVRTLKNFDDLDIQEKGYSFVHDGTVAVSVAGYGYTVAVVSTSGSSSLEVTGTGGTIVYTGKANESVDGVFGMSMQFMGVYGPYKDIFGTGVFVVYTVSSPYGGALQQHVLSLDTLEEIVVPYYLLYHTKDNTQIFATILQQPGAMTLYQDIHLLGVDKSQVLLTGDIDGFSYDGNYIYGYRLSQSEESIVWVIDPVSNSIVHTFQNIGIGHEGTYMLQGNILYVSYGMVDFVREETFQQVMAYDISQQNLLWKVQLD